MKSALIVLSLVMGSAAFAGTQVTKLESICFEAGDSFDSQKKAMEMCQKFAQGLMKSANKDIYFQVTCREGNYTACGYAWNLEAQADITMIQTNTCE